jgi:hypothetical protein
VFPATLIAFLLVFLPIVALWFGADSRRPGIRQW